MSNLAVLIVHESASGCVPLARVSDKNLIELAADIAVSECAERARRIAERDVLRGLIEREEGEQLRRVLATLQAGELRVGASL